MCFIVYASSKHYKEKKTYHDKKLVQRDFKEGQQVFLLNSNKQRKQELMTLNTLTKQRKIIEGSSSLSLSDGV